MICSWITVINSNFGTWCYHGTQSIQDLMMEHMTATSWRWCCIKHSLCARMHFETQWFQMSDNKGKAHGPDMANTKFRIADELHHINTSQLPGNTSLITASCVLQAPSSHHHEVKQGSAKDWPNCWYNKLNGKNFLISMNSSNS